MKDFLSLIFSVLLANILVAQSTDVVMNAGTNGTTVNTCLGGLYDSGGTGANAPYQNNESYVITVCPDVPGDFMTIQWTVFNLDCTDNVPGAGTDADNITIYDGDNTGAPTLGTYFCGDLQPGDIFGATPANPTGCLTIEFNSNANGTGDFNAQLSCETPCDPPTAAGEIVSGTTPDSIAICVGDQVTFQDAGSTPGPSGLFTLEKWVWKWFDGTPNDTLLNPGQVSHIFDTPGQYVIQLVVIDDNDCVNMNATDIQVFVSTYPSFDPFPSDTTICDGASLDLNATPDQYEVEWSGFPLNVTIDDNCMEDLTGIVQPTPMTITGYDPAISLDNTNPDVLSICVEIEHSYLGDFVLQVQCPTGQIMTLHQQGGGGTYLGVPEDYQIDCSDPSTFGVPYQYCFTETATETWVQAAVSNTTIPAGDYLPIDPLGFAALDGCPINGQWNILFTDLWGADDGSLPSWSINFDPALDPPVTTYTPDIGTGSDSSYWDLTAAGIISSSADANSITVAPPVGVNTYTYTVVNDFGCSYDTTVNVTVTANAPIDAGPDTTLCPGEVAVIGPSGAGGASCDYVLELVDSWGDGWNGNTIDIYINGVPTNYTAAGTGSTFIISVNHGDQIDLQWNASGNWQSECEIYFYDANGNLIHSDGTGFTTPSTNMFNFTADCYGGLEFSWIPDNGSLNDVTIPNPTLTAPATTTTYTLTANPVGFPACSVSDDMVVNIGGSVVADVAPPVSFCFEGPPEDLINHLINPTLGGTWYNPMGQMITMPNSPDTMYNGVYEYHRDSLCYQLVTEIDVTIIQLTGTSISLPSDCNACNGSIELDSPNGQTPLLFSDDGGLTFGLNNTFTALCGGTTGTGGTTTYTMIIEDAMGCIVEVTDSVTDTNLPTVDPPVVTDASCNNGCDGEINISGTNLTEYSVDNGNTFQANSAFNGLCPGIYAVVVDNGFGCQATETAVINEPPAIQITNISGPLSVCPGATETYTVTGINDQGQVNYNWVDGQGNLLGTGNPIDITFVNATQICVEMSDDCPTTVSECITVGMSEKVYPSLFPDITSACLKDTVEVFFQNTSTPAANIATTQWNFSDGGSTISTDATHTFNSVGLFDVSMTITTTGGCVYDTTFVDLIEVFDHPEAEFTYNPNPADVNNTEINFVDGSSDDVTAWNWQFGSVALPGSSTVQHPTVVFPEFVPGNYPVTLTVWDDNACWDETSHVVIISNDVTIYAPNIFTPDGDEYNEGWKIYIHGIDIYDFHLMIFNRWGETVWESYNPIGVWNGRYGSGGVVQDGTYVWVLEAKDSFTDKRYEFNGHVTVLK
ncbi:MAG: PKD domain-containing protein [Crocinitomicaceae bacterium]